jgi:hypothetical protein
MDFVKAGNVYLLFYHLHHKIMLCEVPKHKFLNEIENYYILFWFFLQVHQ